MTTWLLDTSVLVQAYRRDYGMDFCPGFWDWLDRESDRGRVFSLDRVALELDAGDRLAKWAKDRPRFFLPLVAEDQLAISRVAQWARSGKYQPAAVQEFLEVADFYLVSVALARNMTLVTHEVPSATVKRIKIPDVCVAMEVPFARPDQMLRLETAYFVLGSRPLHKGFPEAISSKGKE